MNIGILVDSASGFKVEELKDVNIELIPLHIILPDGNDFLDTPELAKEFNFLDRLKNKEDIKTSQASPGELEQKYDEMLGKYDHIIHITITKNISSMNATAQMVANDEKYKNKITILEHNMAANGLKRMALYLDKMIKDGLELDKIIKEAAIIEKESYLGIVPGDLAKLARGGRAKAIIIKLLNIMKTKLLIHWLEKPKNEASGRTITQVTEKLLKILKKKYGSTHYTITFVHTAETNPRYVSSAQKVLDDAKISYITEELPNIYAAHAGVETIGFIVLPNKYFID
ncbi:DegV family protein [Spiroplasma endosymbiont of Labia minor]|uniref:DegV family protein n=1 Tax=Spiroplasma endosymbiont of Labia minor TaxID=3066305 RepID=UPI0030D293A0